MVAAVLIFAVTANVFFTMNDDACTEPEIRKTHLPPISTVTVLANGAASPASAESAEQCANFKLSEQEIGEYICKAGTVAEHDYFHMLDWSPCHASGKVTFKNGVIGTWAIQQYRAGSLKLSSGRTLYLYCPQCQAKAFRLWMIDQNNAGSCDVDLSEVRLEHG
ncbi:hypothetical protein [Massilia brevitalea]|uniref:hypothetical protein n=1 Tax=Massilia brevitalea TaxID=442526 RepID=UPI00273A15D5|nr:hypothetical protein [Massilia brevitalea]